VSSVYPFSDIEFRFRFGRPPYRRGSSRPNFHDRVNGAKVRRCRERDTVTLSAWFISVGSGRTCFPFSPGTCSRRIRVRVQCVHVYGSYVRSPPPVDPKIRLPGGSGRRGTRAHDRHGVNYRSANQVGHGRTSDPERTSFVQPRSGRARIDGGVRLLLRP